MTEEFRVGDTVQVTFEGVVTSVDSLGRINYLGSGVTVPDSADVDLLARSPQPDEDVRGTVRAFGNRYVTYYVKIRDNQWSTIGSGSVLADQFMGETRVVGTIMDLDEQY